MAETLVSRFFANADRLGARPLYHFPSGGRYVPVGWRAAAQHVRELASGLMDLGHRKGDRLAIVSTTRREWMLADLANLAAGGATVGVYPTMTASQSAYVIAHCDARFAVVEDAKQLAKVDSVRSELPALEAVIVIDPTGVTPRDGLLTLDELTERGRAARHDVDARVAELRLEDVATLIYTSGTTGPPKGAMITHANIVGAVCACDVLSIEPETDLGFSFLPLAHSLQRVVDYYGLWKGISGAYARAIETVAEDLALARPSVMASVPRIFEKIYAKIHEQAAAAGGAKKKIFDWALVTGGEVSRRRRAGQPVPGMLRLKYGVAKRLVFDKLRAKLGGRVRIFITGGAPIAREILEFFDAADITILEGWGMTETFATGTLNVPAAVKFGSIGRPLPGIEMKLDQDGEILIKGPNVFPGYYKDEEATKAGFTDDGFFRTGDVGKVDAEGFFTIVDRKKDLIITAGGKNIAPQNLENHLKTDPRISQALCIGDRRPFIVALIAVAPELRASKSEAELQTIVQEIVDVRNRDLASYEQIKKFRLLAQELTQDAGEITPTLKVKRKVVADKYAHLIEEMYGEGKAPKAVA